MSLAKFALKLLKCCFVLAKQGEPRVGEGKLDLSKITTTMIFFAVDVPTFILF